MKEQKEKLEIKRILESISPKNRQFLGSLEVFEIIDSTNTYLLSQAKLSSVSGNVCFAEEQTAGRGRQGREWFSPYATNIYCSMGWSFPLSFPWLSALSIACASIIIQTLKGLGLDQGLSVKWPNDIFFAGRKLAGILIEIQLSSDKQWLVVIGIGLNLNLPEEKRKAWVGIEEALAKPISRNVVAGALLDELIAGLLLFEEQGLKPFLPLYREYDQLLNKEVVLHTPSTSFSGRVLGINDQGELLLIDQENKKHCFCYGEVSLNPVLGVCD